MAKAVIYARYSSEQQSDRSIEDQVTLCQQLASREALEVVGVYEDRAISGASAARPGLQSMMRAASAGAFSVVICEGPSRIGRRLADTADIHDRLKFLGVQLLTVQHGRMSDLHVGILGTMAQMQLTELRAQTVRGQRGVVRDSRVPGGISYGYATVAGGRPGERRIVEDEARIIRRIFREYAAGVSANAIAKALNREGIPGPRTSAWGHTSICGHRKRGTGILNNRLYRGELVYGMSEFRRDPHTGKRVSRIRAGGVLEMVNIETLRIVDDELWQRVQTRHGLLDAKAAASRNPLRGRQRASYPFSGLLFCGCGAGYQIVGKDRYGCAARRAGRCENSRTVDRHMVERRILSGLRDNLLSPVAIEAAVEEARLALAETNREADAQEGRLRRRLGEVVRSLDRFVDAIADGAPVRQLKGKMEELEAERVQIERQIEAISLDRSVMPTVPHPRIAEAYRRRVEDLSMLLVGESVEAQEALNVVRSLIGHVEIVLDAQAPDGVWLEISGDLGQLLHFSERGQAKAPSADALGALQLSVVAGTGFEPVTFRL